MSEIVQLFQDDEERLPTYSVANSILETKAGDFPCFLVLKGGVPALELNPHLILKQKKWAHPCSTEAYLIANFLNEMAAGNIDICDITRAHVYDYLIDEYVEEGKSLRTILTYTAQLGDMFEDLFIHGMKLHPSLTTQDPDSLLVVKNKKDLRRATTIHSMRHDFIPNKNAVMRNAMVSYTKWYTKEQIEALAAELPLVHRCIFLDTVMTGHRVDSALSVMLDTFDARSQFIMPTRTKTGRSHKSYVPEYLADLISTYQIEERVRIVSKTGSNSPYLFLGRTGKPVSYGSYRSTLQKAAERVRANHPELGLTEVHTHAGRSTFAAALRSYQKAQQAKGIHTFTDDDFCKLMDWSSLQCLENYDILTRVQALSPLVEDFQDDFFSFSHEALER